MKTIDVVLQMQQTADQNHKELVGVVNTGFAKVNDALNAHALEDVRRFSDVEQRLKPVEAVHRMLRWTIGVGVAALLTGAADFAFNHLPALLAKGK